MGDGVQLGGIFDTLGREGVGEDGEEEGTRTRRMELVGMLRFTNGGPVNLRGAFAGHSRSLLDLAFFLLYVSLAFASNII